MKFWLLAKLQLSSTRSEKKPLEAFSAFVLKVFFKFGTSRPLALVVVGTPSSLHLLMAMILYS